MQSEDFLQRFNTFRTFFEPILYKIQQGDKITSIESSDVSVAWSSLCEVLTKKEEKTTEEETSFPRCSGNQFGFEKKEYDISFVYAPNAMNVYQIIRDGLAAQNVAVGTTQAFENDSHDYSHRTEQERVIAKSNNVVLVLSKDSLKNSFVLFSCHAALAYNIRIILIHVQESAPFPSPVEQPQFLKGQDVFSHKATTFLEQFAGTAIDALVKKLKKVDTSSEDISCRLFLSHKRSSGQGIAGRLFEGFKNHYKVFLDSEADFDIHDLQLIVKQTNTFIFILSHGILDSLWCLKELEAAVLYGKRIIFVRDFQFQFPKTWPDMVTPELKELLLNAKPVIYMAEFYSQCVEKLKEMIGVSDSLIKAFESCLTSESLSAILNNQVPNGALLLEAKPNIVPAINLKEVQSALVNYYYRFLLNQVKEIHLRGFDTGADEGIEALLDVCPNLNGFFLSHADITDKGLRIISEKKGENVAHLDVSYSLVTPDALVNFVLAQKELQSLGIAQSAITDQHISLIVSKLSHLKFLNLCNSSIQDEGIVALAKACHSLRHLNVRLVAAKEASIEQLIAANPELETLDASQTKITDHTIQVTVEHCHQLVHLNVGGTLVTSTGLQPLKNCPNLKTINAYDLPVQNVATVVADGQWKEALGAYSYKDAQSFSEYWSTLTVAPASAAFLDDNKVMHLQNRGFIRTKASYNPGERPIKIIGSFRFLDREKWQECDYFSIVTRSNGVLKLDDWFWHDKGISMMFSGFRNTLHPNYPVGPNPPPTATGVNPLNWNTFEVEDDGNTVRLTVNNSAQWISNQKNVLNFVGFYNRDNTGHVKNLYHTEIANVRIMVRPF
mmetsp:Transcript_4017/g.5638  ORF Transcript_4017/g.5638 Transcript_4017/m.5638 type:complete len:839 (+) Transcript_4017:81-2597(+)